GGRVRRRPAEPTGARAAPGRARAAGPAPDATLAVRARLAAEPRLPRAATARAECRLGRGALHRARGAERERLPDAHAGAGPRRGDRGPVPGCPHPPVDPSRNRLRPGAIRGGTRVLLWGCSASRPTARGSRRRSLVAPCGPRP